MPIREVQPAIAGVSAVKRVALVIGMLLSVPALAYDVAEEHTILLEVDTEHPRAEVLPSVVRVINDRLGGQGRAAAIGDRRVKLTLRSPAKQFHSLYRLATCVGQIELRQLASAGLDREASAQATALPQGINELNLNGRPVAAWVACQPKRFAPAQAVVRQSGGGRQVLTLCSLAPLGGEHLTDIRLAVRGNDTASVQLILGARGTAILKKLRPPEDGAAARTLALLLDGRLVGVASGIRWGKTATVPFDAAADDAKAVYAVAMYGVLPCSLKEVALPAARRGEGS
jgi:hypothetical protein